MELSLLFEIVVLIAIVVEILSLRRYHSLVQKNGNYMNQLDEHMMKLTEHLELVFPKLTIKGKKK